MGWRRRARSILALLLTLLFVACGSSAPPPKVAKKAPKKAAIPKTDIPLAEITNQFLLDKAWDGKFDDCQRYGQVAMAIAADDLETMELYLRCASAHGTLWQAEAWVRSAYAVRLSSPVVRYAEGIARMLRGDPGTARKIFEKLGKEAPAAWYQAAIAAQIDDDSLAAEKDVEAYVKAVPNDPAGRMLQAEIVCASDLARCQAMLDTVASTDDDDTVVARRLGAGLGGYGAVTRKTLERLSKEAGAISAPAFDDAYSVAAMSREGGEVTVFVRSPRTGRGEPGPNVDLVRDARPMKRLPFATRVRMALVHNDPAAGAWYAHMLALFPTELATYDLARTNDKLEQIVRKTMENAAGVRWRVVAASLLAHSDELCPLVAGFPWTDRGPIATSTRARCEMVADAARGRKIADDRLNAPPFGVIDVETAIEGEVLQKDDAALVALAKRIAKSAPTSLVVSDAYFAAGELLAKKQAAPVLAQALAASAYDPTIARRVLHRYVEAHDVDAAKATIKPSLLEAPLDAYLCGVQGEILLNAGKSNDALQFLTKSCTSARARHEKDILDDTLAMIPIAAVKSKDKAAKEAAWKCAKGD